MGRECYHCHQWVEDKAQHDCWTTTERALTLDLSEDLMAAWERLRETASEFGEQRIYASHAEEKVSGDLVFPGTEPQGAHGAQDCAIFKTQGGSHGSSDSP